MTRFLILILLLATVCVNAQTSYTQPSVSFLDYQRTFPRVSDALKKKEDTLAKQFAQKKLQWPASYVYIRSFKYDSELEVWVKNKKNEPYQLFKTYKVCAMAGSLGPKRMEGDYQVPEGFYYINQFNPRSTYYLSLGISYPNASDRLLSDSLQPGGGIYIHGSCVTVGCIPITDPQIEELYLIAAGAKNNGQDFIPVHIFPIQFKNKKSSEYLNTLLQTYPEYTDLTDRLKEVYYYFNQNKRIPLILVDSKGEYIPDEDAKNSIPPPDPVVVKRVYVKKARTVVPFDEKEIPTSVNNLPVYPKGNDAFQAYLKQLGKDASVYLPEGQHAAFIQIEFIVDKTGKIINPKIIRGSSSDELNDYILDAFEAMPKWVPAIRLEQNVAMKLKQTIAVEDK